MPKDEFDFDDPMELNGMALLSDDDTTDAMTECFIEEFMRLGWNHKQILALFRHPHYIGMNMVMQNRGENYVKDFIAEVFARWGRKVVWDSSAPNPLTPALSPGEREKVIPPTKKSKAAPDIPARDLLFPAHEPEGRASLSQRAGRRTEEPETVVGMVRRRAEDRRALPLHRGSGVQSANQDSGKSLPEGEGQGEGEKGANRSASENHKQITVLNTTACDPMGAAIPKLTL